MTNNEAKQAQQLDSVTDVVQEQEVDITKAQQALSQFSTKTNNTNNSTSSQQQQQQQDSFVVAQEDIDLIVSELEVTEEMAQQTLRQVATSGSKPSDKETMIVAALRKLVTM